MDSVEQIQNAELYNIMPCSAVFACWVKTANGQEETLVVIRCSFFVNSVKA